MFAPQPPTGELHAVLKCVLHFVATCDRAPPATRLHRADDRAHRPV